ncbi:MAG: putative collagen-binding domain-containing protein [Pirellulaceae bacterium]
MGQEADTNCHAGTTTSPNGEASLWSLSREAHAGPQVSVLRSVAGDLAFLYFASGGQFTLDRSKLAEPLLAEWYNPRDGSSRRANSV